MPKFELISLTFQTSGLKSTSRSRAVFNNNGITINVPDPSSVVLVARSSPLPDV